MHGLAPPLHPRPSVHIRLTSVSRAVVAFGALSLLAAGARADRVRGRRQAYSTGKVVGRGAWSEVVEATPAGGGPPAVIKLIARTGDDPATARREAERQFRRELGVLQRLGAIDGFPLLLDHGRHDGKPFLVLGRLPGVNLHEWLRARADAPTEREAVDVLLRAADRLIALHALGYQHRDVKPGNILVDERGEVSLVDVGEAGARRARHVGASRFMAPEQLRDGARTPATDVFGLAATALFLRKIMVPFVDRDAAPEERRRRFDEALSKIADPTLRAVLRRALEPAAEDRHPRMADFAAALRAWRDARPAATGR